MDLFGAGAVARFAVLQLLKVVAPLRIDALRIGEELLVQGFDVRSVAARQRRRSQQLAKAWGHTEKKSCGLKVLERSKGRYVSRSRPRPKGDQYLI